MADVIDLTTVQLHATLPESVRWPVTKRIAAVELRRGDTFGLRVTLAPYNPAKHRDSWPDRIPDGWDGTLRWTLCLAVQIGGTWHGAAFQEMWHDRAWTGAPLHTTWQDGWADSRGWAGPQLTAHQPRLGDRVLVWAVAGQLRMNKQAAAGNEHMLTVRERSNVVAFELVETGLYAFADPSPVVAPPIITTPPVLPPPASVPPVVAPPDPSLADLLLRMARAEDHLEQLHSRLNAVDNVVMTLPPVPTHTTPTTARFFGVTIPIPAVPLIRL